MKMDEFVPDVFIICSIFPEPFLKAMKKHNFMPKMTIVSPIFQYIWYYIEPELRNYITGVLPFFVFSLFSLFFPSSHIFLVRNACEFWWR